MQTYLANGIVLQALDFKEFDQIVTVFTENEGLIKFMVKGGNSAKKGLKNSPLTRAEFVYSIGRSELYLLKEMTTKDHYLDLRKSFKSLNLACTFLKAILSSQMLHKPAPILYRLLLAYLAKIPSFSNHDALESSFLLKILDHEGILDLNPDGFFSSDELILLEGLASTTSFKLLEEICLPDDLTHKIQLFFKEAN